MSINPKSSPPQNNYKGKLARKVFFLCTITILLPITISTGGYLIFIAGADVNQAFIQTSVFFLVGLSISLIFVGFISNQIVKPVKELEEIISLLVDSDTEKQATIKNNDEIGYLANSINHLARNYSSMKKSSESEILSLTKRLQITAELSKASTSSINLEQILKLFADLIADQFGYFQVSVFVLDHSGEYAVLKSLSGKSGVRTELEGYKVGVGSRSMVGWVTKNNKARVSSDVKEDPFFMPFPNLQSINSELSLPISIGDSVLGSLDIQELEQNAFSWDEVTTLQILSDQLALAISQHRSLESARIDPRMSAALFEASHKITIATTADEVILGMKNAILKMPFRSAFFIADSNTFNPIVVTDYLGTQVIRETIPTLTVSPQEVTETIPNTLPLSISTIEQQKAKIPASMHSFCEQLGYADLYLYPLYVRDSLIGLLFIGSDQGEFLNSSVIDAMTSLVEITKASLEKVVALNEKTDQLIELQTLNAVSQSISMETNLYKLYEVIHEQIKTVMGDVNFLIAIYSDEGGTIEIPYMEEEDRITSIPPFPLGQGLTSVVIQTRQPLLIVEDTENRARALGAIVTDSKPALSWLGVPIITGGNIMGAIVVQDLQNENRFDEDDVRFLSTLAAQTAIAIRNTQLIASTQGQAERDRQLYTITDKIWQAINIEEVLTTTIEELGKQLDVDRAHIEISLEPEINLSGGNGTKGIEEIEE